MPMKKKDKRDANESHNGMEILAVLICRYNEFKFIAHMNGNEPKVDPKEISHEDISRTKRNRKVGKGHNQSP